jgi:filamentous hemagglutinin family protein
MTTPINPVTLITGTVLLSLLSTVQAEVITDGTVGQGPPRLVEGPNYQISDDLGAKNYTNLYHSFDKFNINTGETATFTGPQNITNVFGRVTGGSGSVIDGQIRSEMPMADIYLINPNGILFGENASLDVPGSFYASTANQIILKDGTEFSATHPQNHPPTLSAAPFEAFGFLDHNQATLSVNGSSLEVSEGETLALVGRHVQLENAAEISSGGQIQIDTNNSATGDISVANSKIAVITEGEGRVFFRGGKLVVENSAIQMDSKSANSQIEIDTTAMQLTDNSRISLRASTTEAGKVVIGTGHLDMLELDNSAIRTNTYGAGNAGDVFLTAQQINMSNGSDISAQTSGAGNAGRLRIIAEKQLRLSNSKIKSDTQPGSDGKGGRIAIQTPSLEGVGATISAEHRGNNTKTRANISLSGASSAEAKEVNLTNSVISANTFGPGNAGDLTINANEISLNENTKIEAGTTSRGEGGTVSINTARLEVTDSSLVVGTTGSGKGGELQIKATDSITLSGNSSHNIAGAPLYAITVDTRSTSQSGNAQTAYIETPRLIMNKEATISASTFGPGNAGDLTINANEISLNESSHIQAATLSRGEGGFVSINTARLEVTDSSLAVGTIGSGKGGELQIKATDSITLSGNSSHNIAGAPLYAIAVDTRSTAQSGNAQTADIETPRLTMTNGATISAITLGPGNAGDLTINANEISLNENSKIQAATLNSGSGEGGTVSINTARLEVTDSSLAVGTTGSGKGGQLQIKATDSITLSGNSSHNIAGAPLYAIAVDTRSTAQSGNAQTAYIETPRLTMTNGATMSAATFGPGNAGDLTINANEISLNQNSLIQAATFKSGNAGSLGINTGTLEIKDSSIAMGTVGSGKGGDLQIKATDSIKLSGESSIRTSNERVTDGIPLFSITVDSRNSGDATSTREPSRIQTPNLTLENGAAISVATFGSGKGGDLEIDAENISVENSNIVATTIGSGEGGSIDILTSNLELSGTTTNSFLKNYQVSTIDVSTRGTQTDSGNSGLLTIGPSSEKRPTLKIRDGASMSSATFGYGQGGDIRLDVNTLTLTNGGQITSSSSAEGQAGNIAITASEYINIFGNNSGIFSTSGEENNTQATGNAGQITLGEQTKSVPTLRLDDGGKISTTAYGTGDSGTIELFVNDLQVPEGSITSVSQTGRNGANPANITIDVNKLTLGDKEGKRGYIESSTEGASAAGKITITASEYLKIVGDNTNNAETTSGIFSETNSTEATAGNAGTITINMPTSGTAHPALLLTKNGRISTTTSGTGQGGEIALNLNSLEITEGGRIESSTTNAGSAGEITITASDYINIFGNNSGIFSTSGEENNTQAIGNAGQIIIGSNSNPVNSLILEGGKINTTTWYLGQGGEIDLNVNTLEIKGGRIESSTKSKGHAGTITIAASENIKIVGDNSNNAETISGIFSETNSTEATAGNAGTITINMPTSGTAHPALLLTKNGRISTTTSGTGQGGEIALNLNSLEITEGGRIESSTTNAGSAGEITITASDYINIFGNNSGIFSTSGEENNTQAIGNAGQIIIGSNSNPVNSLILEGGKINTTTWYLGQGGEIDLNVNTLEIKGGRIESSTKSKGHAGTITIAASENIKIVGDNSNNAETISGIFSETNSTEATAGNAGTITIDMPTSGTDHPALFLTKNGRISTTTLGTGQGGEIALNLNTLEITEGGRIESSTRSEGHAGTITITASENIKIVGDNSNRAETTSGIFSETNSTEATAGNAGTITIDMPTSGTDDPALLLTKNGRISTITSGTGQGGEIALNLNSLEISEGGRIESSTTDAGSAGKITITASEYINIWGGKILSTALKTGNAGEITIEAGNHQFGETKDIREFIDNPDDIEQLPFILAEEGGLSLQNGGKISTSTQGKGEGGKIQITTSQLELKTQASISATSEQAAAGNIVIGTNQLNMSGSTISTSSAASKGGEILIGVRKVNNKRIINSTLSAKAGERGDGGNLLIRGKPEYLILDNTDLIAKAEQGDGGEIAVDANVFIASGDSEVSASSNKGIDGEVNIDSAQIDVESINLLPSRPVDASKLIKDCVASDSEEEWSLVQVGYKVTTFQNRTGCRSQ